MFTDIEIKILEKGLKFTPTPRSKNMEEITNDTDAFCRRLRLAEFFLDIENDDESIVANKNDFMPPKGRNQNLDKFINTVKTFPVEQCVRKNNTTRNNLNKLEWNAIENIRHYENIIIKEADKGSAVVIMDREYYKSMCLSVLENSSYYEKQLTYESKKVMEKLETIIDEYGQKLTAKETAYLLSFNIKTSNFYGLPKIHKSQTIKDECKISGSTYISVASPADLTIRPIVAGPTCETHRISNLLDILLKPYVTKVQSYIRDTVDFLNTIPEKVNPNPFWFHLMSPISILTFHIILDSSQ